MGEKDSTCFAQCRNECMDGLKKENAVLYHAIYSNSKT
jgi:hypothetical protein